MLAKSNTTLSNLNLKVLASELFIGSFLYFKAVHKYIFLLSQLVHTLLKYGDVGNELQDIKVFVRFQRILMSVHVKTKTKKTKTI